MQVVRRGVWGYGGTWLQSEVWREAAKRLPIRDASDVDETHFQDCGNGPKDGWMLQDKKNMFLPIKEGIAEVLHKLQKLYQDTEYTKGWTGSFECHLGRAVGR